MLEFLTGLAVVIFALWVITGVGTLIALSEPSYDPMRLPWWAWVLIYLPWIAAALFGIYHLGSWVLHG